MRHRAIEKNNQIPPPTAATVMMMNRIARPLPKLIDDLADDFDMYIACFGRAFVIRGSLVFMVREVYRA